MIGYIGAAKDEAAPDAAPQDHATHVQSSWVAAPHQIAAHGRKVHIDYGDVLVHSGVDCNVARRLDAEMRCGHHPQLQRVVHAALEGRAGAADVAKEVDGIVDRAESDDTAVRAAARAWDERAWHPAHAQALHNAPQSQYGPLRVSPAPTPKTPIGTEPPAPQGGAGGWGVALGFAALFGLFVYATAARAR